MFLRQDGFLDRSQGRPLIMDEIQYVPELLTYIKLRIDRERDHCGRFLMTGSQRFQLMRGVSESLAGRVAVLELLPFSVLEVPARLGLGQLLWRGGFPDPCLHPGSRDVWVKSYISTYVERDVRQLKNVGDLRAFEQFLGLCAARHGQLFNAAALSRDCGVTQPTAKAWLGVLEASYVALVLQPYFNNFGKRLVRAPKLYMLDPALVCEITRQPSPAAALAGPMAGALFEGLVVAEVHKAFAERGLRPAAWFWRSHDGLEVDLVLQAGGLLHPVEVKLTSTPTPRHLEPIERFRALAGKKATAPGILVCQVPGPLAMPWGLRAMPLRAFAEWLREALR